MLRVVEQACQFAPDMSRGTVVIESDNVKEFNMAIEELQGTEARNLATGYAAQRGMGDARLNGSPGAAYPINLQGLSLEAVHGPNGEALPQTHQLMQPARYRIDVPVTRRLI